MPEKRSRILYVKRFLEEQADEIHPVIITDIIAYLADEGIAANRKTVAQDIEQLIEADVDVVCNKGRPNKYFVGDRHFEIPELKLLIDAAQASNFLTAKRSKALIDKLLAFASCHQAIDLSDGLYFDNLIKPINENAYITADLLLTAISSRKLVRFMYYEYTPDKKKTYKHNRQVYEFSPWRFIWNNDSYYIIGYSEKHNKAIRFRIDRIAAPKLTELNAVPMPDNLDLAAFIKSIFQMYDGPLLDVTLKCENAMMKTIIDRFGEDVYTAIADAEHFHAKVSVLVSKTFYGWLFGMGGSIKITAPAEAVEAYRKMLGHAAKSVVPKDGWEGIK